MKANAAAMPGKALSIYRNFRSIRNLGFYKSKSNSRKSQVQVLDSQVRVQVRVLGLQVRVQVQVNKNRIRVGLGSKSLTRVLHLWSLVYRHRHLNDKLPPMVSPI